MLLQNKIAVIYGAGGAIGGEVARAFAHEGARVFLTGRSAEPLKKIAQSIRNAGGQAEVAIVDAGNEREVTDHLKQVFEKEGRIDISFNVTGISQTGVQGIPLLQLSVGGFMRPVNHYVSANFITAKAAGIYMMRQGAGVIVTLTATPSKAAAPLVGGMAPSWASIEALTRTFATELGAYGVRVVCLRPDGIPETDTITEVFGLHAQGAGMASNKEFQQLMESMTLLKRLPNLKEVANTAAFIASDKASAITGTVINLSCGSIID